MYREIDSSVVQSNQLTTIKNKYQKNVSEDITYIALQGRYIERCTEQDGLP